MNPLIVLPVVHEETALKCIQSIDLGLHESLYVVDNSTDQFTKRWDFTNEFFQTYWPDENIGVARSWNKGVESVKRYDMDFLVILSASVVFKDGMLGFIRELNKNRFNLGMMTQEGWHCLALSKKVFEGIGNFDTNFYPGYYEDSDFIRRMELARIHEPCGSIHIPGTSIDVHPAEVAHGMKRAGIKVNMQACADYFLRKWGAMPAYDSQASRDKMYQYPFNNPDLSLDYYEQKTIPELKLLYNLA